MDFEGTFTIGRPHKTKLILLGLSRALKFFLHMLNAIVSPTKMVLISLDVIIFFLFLFLPGDVQNIKCGDIWYVGIYC